MITEYGVRLDTGEIAQFPGTPLMQYLVLAERNRGSQVVFRLVGEWQDYTGERSDPVDQPETMLRNFQEYWTQACLQEANQEGGIKRRPTHVVGDALYAATTDYFRRK